MDAKDKICEYFQNGCTSRRCIGLELEHFVMKNNKPFNYSDGVKDILTEISVGAKSVFSESGNILGADMGEYTLTLEPGAQLEVSVVPFENVSDIKRVLNSFYQTAEPVLKKYDAELCVLPAVDKKNLDSIELIPKERYRYMDMYFQKSGTMGRYMMRGSASTQVSVDYESEKDFVKKFRAAYILSPFFALISANGRGLKRIEIWDDVDNARTYIPRYLFSDSFGFEAYADELLKVPVIFVPAGDGFVYTGNDTIQTVSDKYGSSEAMTEHYLSMVFPDVRLKKYIEIRIADAMPAKRATEYAELIKNIFYTNALDEIIDRYSGVTVADIKEAKHKIKTDGKNAIIYGKRAETELEYLLSFMR